MIVGILFCFQFNWEQYTESFNAIHVKSNSTWEHFAAHKLRASNKLVNVHAAAVPVRAKLSDEILSIASLPCQEKLNNSEIKISKKNYIPAFNFWGTY
jgi:hypothetical protein